MVGGSVNGRAAGQCRNRVNKVCGCVRGAAGFAVIAVLVGGFALGTGALDEAIRQKQAFLGVIGLNDFPHSDATWPHSQELLAEHTADMSEWEKDRILHDNVAELYGLNV